MIVNLRLTVFTFCSASKPSRSCKMAFEVPVLPLERSTSPEAWRLFKASYRAAGAGLSRAALLSTPRRPCTGIELRIASERSGGGSP